MFHQRMFPLIIWMLPFFWTTGFFLRTVFFVSYPFGCLRASRCAAQISCFWNVYTERIVIHSNILIFNEGGGKSVCLSVYLCTYFSALVEFHPPVRRAVPRENTACEESPVCVCHCAAVMSSPCNPKITCSILMISGVTNTVSCPGWCSSMDWAQACQPKGLRFNSKSGHRPGLWQLPSRGCMRGNHTLMFLYLSLFLPPFLSL